MFLLDKFTASGERFKRNEDGNMAITFAFTLTTLVILMGSAMDYSTLSKAHNTSQSLAEATALNAAIFIKNHGRVPKNESEGYMDGHTYTATELGHTYKGMIAGGPDNVTATVTYDDNAKEARVTVTGATVPTFVQVTGKTRLPFRAEAVVSYMEIEDKFPASIALVMDNSGSMRFDDKIAEDPYQSYGAWYGDKPADAQIRIDGLKSSASTFVSELQSRLGDETSAGQRTIRMGQLPYSSDILERGRHNIGWGFLPQGKISVMSPDGSTNSSPPMDKVREWMEGEDKAHEDEAIRTNGEYKEPLKFVIFMTDGQNTAGNYMLVRASTGRWYQQRSDGRWSRSRSYIPGYEEGYLILATDTETKSSCQQMKDDGVTIFTIGYALEVGPFLVNGWNNYPENRAYPVGQEVQSAAYNLMASCATSEDHFIKAEDASELEAAFDNIQNAIVEELIRVKS